MDLCPNPLRSTSHSDPNPTLGIFLPLMAPTCTFSLKTCPWATGDVLSAQADSCEFLGTQSSCGQDNFEIYSRARLWHQAEATLHETLSRIVLLLGHFSLPDLSPRTLTRSWVAFLDKPLVQGSSSQSLSWETPPKHQLNPQALCDTVPGPLR